MAKDITSATPRLAFYTQTIMNELDTARRSFTDVGFFLEPTRVLGSCMGISSRYAAADHGDVTDMFFTSVVSAKCGKTLKCLCDVRGCEKALFAPKSSAWYKGALY